MSHRSRSRRFILTTLLVGMQLMLMAAAGVQAQGTSFTAIPRGDEWKYQVVAHGAGAGFEAVGFDDSAWSTGQAAFGTATFNGAVVCPWITTTTVKTSWPINTDILLRKEFSLPAGANNLQVKGDIDNNATVYINGAQIGHVNGGNCVQNLINFTAPDSVLQTGSNIIAIRGHDEGVVNFLDVQVTYEVAPTTAPCEPGTFSESGFQPCEEAPAGKFVDSPEAIAATPCAAGTYQPNTGQTSCLQADPGYYVATAGAIAQIECPDGKTSAAGATECHLNPGLYHINGFYQPVDMSGVVNTVKGGSTVPLKFEVFDGNVELTDTAIVTMSAKQITCDPAAPTEAIEEIVTAGGTGLRYDATAGQFVFNWKAPKKAGDCYAVTATTTDGSSVTALFKLK